MHLARTAPLALLVGLAACGSSSAQVVTSRPTAKTAAATATAAPAQASATAKRVSIKNFEFSPKTLTVAKGTKVTWTNKDSANHTVTFKKGPGDLGNLNHNRSASATFTKTGRFTYVCQYHPNMHGTVIVK